MQCTCAILPSVACPALKDFPHNLINDTIFEKKKSLNIKCMFPASLQHLSETFFLFQEKLSEISKIYIGLHVKYPLFLSDFN